MIILGTLLLAAAVMAYVSYPLWASEPTPQTGGRKSKAGSESTRTSVAATVSDVDELELDRQIGRLDEQDYAALQGTRLADSATPGVGQGRNKDNEDDADDEIERRVRALRQERARQLPNRSQKHP